MHLVKVYVRAENKDLLWIDKVIPKILDTKSTKQSRTTARQLDEATAIDLDFTSEERTVGRQVKNSKALNKQIDIYLLSVAFGFWGIEFILIYFLSEYSKLANEIELGVSFFELFAVFILFTYFNTTISGFITIIMRLSKEWLKTFPQLRE